MAIESGRPFVRKIVLTHCSNCQQYCSPEKARVMGRNASVLCTDCDGDSMEGAIRPFMESGSFQRPQIHSNVVFGGHMNNCSVVDTCVVCRDSPAMVLAECGHLFCMQCVLVMHGGCCPYRCQQRINRIQVIPRRFIYVSENE